MPQKVRLPYTHVYVQAHVMHDSTVELKVQKHGTPEQCYGLLQDARQRGVQPIPGAVRAMGMVLTVAAWESL